MEGVTLETRITDVTTTMTITKETDVQNLTEIQIKIVHHLEKNMIHLGGNENFEEKILVTFNTIDEKGRGFDPTIPANIKVPGGDSVVEALKGMAFLVEDRADLEVASVTEILMVAIALVLVEVEVDLDRQETTEVAPMITASVGEGVSGNGIVMMTTETAMDLAVGKKMTKAFEEIEGTHQLIVDVVLIEMDQASRFEKVSSDSYVPHDLSCDYITSE